ncbi:MAG TPA: hypothetical protein VFZ07_07890 [Dongiaceae bacterium]
MPDLLRQQIESETAGAFPEAATKLSDAIRAQHDDGVAAVIFYGSCLRQREIRPEEMVFDFFVLVDDYRRFYGRRWPAMANYLLPPNVFQIAVASGHRKTLRAKYAVVTLAQFHDLVSPRTFHSYFWARFAQPTRLVYARDAQSREAVIEALMQSVTAMAGAAAGLMTAPFAPGDLWKEAFRHTYAAELRAEKAGRGEHVYVADAARYDALAEPALAAAGLAVTRLENGRLSLQNGGGSRTKADAVWALRRWYGKLISVARLTKAVFTFDGGLDYILWKIERHSGVSATVTDWQRRHPLLAAPGLAWRLYRRGAFR